MKITLANLVTITAHYLHWLKTDMQYDTRPQNPNSIIYKLSKRQLYQFEREATALWLQTLAYTNGHFPQVLATDNHTLSWIIHEIERCARDRYFTSIRKAA